MGLATKPRLLVPRWVVWVGFWLGAIGGFVFGLAIGVNL